MEGEGDDPVEAALAWLHRTHPDAAVFGLDASLRRVPVPASLGFAEIPPGDEAGGRVDLSTVRVDDRPGVIRAYERARTRGVSSVAVQLVNGERSQLHFVDLRAAHGFVLIATTPDEGGATGDDYEVARFPAAPRYSWATLNGDGIIQAVSDAAEAVFGWAEDELVGQQAMPFIHADDHDKAISNWVDVLTSPGERRTYRCRHLRPDGSHCWVDITNQNRLADPDHRDVLSEMVDISDEVEAHEAVREREQLLRELTDALPVGLVQFDAERVVLHENEQLRELVGQPGLKGLLDAPVDEDGRAALDAAVVAVLAGFTPSPIEVHLEEDRVCSVTFSHVLGTGGLAMVADVTESFRLRQELEERATFDALTACYSRTAILGALDRITPDGPGTGVVFVDLDRFKPVNDEFGHAAGDELLAVIGDRLRAAVRDVDLVGRLGGDEFLVVCPGVAGPDVVAAIARRIGVELSAPMSLAEEHLVRPRASIGVAWAPAGTDPDELVARADAAMYESKRQPASEPNSPTKLTISPG